MRLAVTTAKLRLAQIVLLFLGVIMSVVVGCVDGQAQGSGSVFSTLASIKATAPQDDLVNTIQDFAASEDLQVGMGDFPKDGRIIRNITLRRNDLTFFHIDNILSNRYFIVSAYSHEPEENWRPIWLRLVAALKHRYGEGNIQPR